jgi:hypothetical protein
VVHYGPVDVVWNIRGSFSGSVVVQGVAGIIVLNALGRGEPELSPHLRSNHPHWAIL